MVLIILLNLILLTMGYLREFEIGTKVCILIIIKSLNTMLRR